MKNITIENIISIINSSIKFDPPLSHSNANLDLTSAGMDSISFIQLVVALEEAFDCEVPDSKLLPQELNTPQKIFDTLLSNDE